jgi:hypothetical protein
MLDILCYINESRELKDKRYRPEVAQRVAGS